MPFDRRRIFDSKQAEQDHQIAIARWHLMDAVAEVVLPCGGKLWRVVAPSVEALSVSSFRARLMNPKSFTWIELEALYSPLGHRLPNFERRYLPLDFIDGGIADGGRGCGVSHMRSVRRLRFGHTGSRSLGRPALSSP